MSQNRVLRMEKLGVERALHSYTRSLEPTRVNQMQILDTEGKKMDATCM
jgi:hypothetical protein